MRWHLKLIVAVIRLRMRLPTVLALWHVRMVTVACTHEPALVSCAMLLLFCLHCCPPGLVLSYALCTLCELRQKLLEIAPARCLHQPRRRKLTLASHARVDITDVAGPASFRRQQRR